MEEKKNNFLKDENLLNYYLEQIKCKHEGYSHVYIKPKNLREKQFYFKCFGCDYSFNIIKDEKYTTSTFHPTSCTFIQNQKCHSENCMGIIKEDQKYSFRDNILTEYQIKSKFFEF
jgi:hypothetical protein